MKTSKAVIGIVAGPVIAAVLIPKSRKFITDALCSLTGVIKDLANKADDVSDTANDLAGSVDSVRKAVS